MIIKKLNLSGFGKFCNKQIELKEGINLIYGNNEAGKSTLHRFIEGQFFGLDPFDKYKPWDGTEFHGELSFLQNNQNVTIERDYNQQTISMKDSITGEDLNQSYVSDDTDRIEPGKKLFGVGRRFFRNTFSINQLGSRTEEELLVEIKKKIENITKTKDDSINMSRILDALDKVGSGLNDEESIQTQLEKNENELEELQNKKKIREQHNLKLYRKLVKIEILQKQVKDGKQKLSEINEILEEIDNESLIETYESVLKLEDEIQDLNEAIGTSESVLDINMDEYEKLIRSITKIEQLEEAENELQVKKIAIEQEVSDIRNNYQINNGEESLKSIPTDYQLYLEQTGMLDRLSSRIDAIKEEISVFQSKNHSNIVEAFEKFNENLGEIRYLKGLLSSDILNVMSQKMKVEKRKRCLISILAVILAGGVGYGAYWATQFFQDPRYYLGLLALILPVAIIKSTTRSTRLIRSLKFEKHIVNEEKTSSKNHLAYLVEENNQLIIDSDCSNFNELKSKYATALSELNQVEEKKKNLETIEEEYDFIRRKRDETAEYLMKQVRPFGYNALNDEVIEDVTIRIQEAQKKFEKLENFEANVSELQFELKKMDREKNEHLKMVEDLLTKNEVDSISELKRRIREQKDLQDKVALRKEKVEKKEALLDGKSVVEMKSKIEKSKKSLEQMPFNSKEEVFQLRAVVMDEKDVFAQQIQQLKNALRHHEESLPTSAEIEEAIEYGEYHKKRLQNQFSMVQETKNQLMASAKMVQEDFEPKLIRKISVYLEKLTDRRYQQIMIDSNYQISLCNADSDKTVDVESLSAGTIDQLYFSVRVALIEMLSKDQSAPMILDDCFTQYDEERLKNALALLSKISENRQILLFTCHKREKELLEEMNKEFQFIQL